MLVECFSRLGPASSLTTQDLGFDFRQDKDFKASESNMRSRHPPAERLPEVL